MIYVEDRGSTRSGKTYLPPYIEHVPDDRRLEFIKNLANSRTVDVDSLSSLMKELSLTQKAEEPKKTLRECGAPSSFAMREPILYPDLEGMEYYLSPKLIHMMKDIAFARTEDEDPNHHLTKVYDICDTFGPAGIPKEFVLLKLFRWSLKDKAFTWLQSLPNNSITSWMGCTKEFIQKFTSFDKMLQIKRDITNFFQKIGESFAQAWERFSRLLMSVPNHGFKDYSIVQYFYNGLTDNTKQMIDSSVGGSLNKLTVVASARP